MEGKRSYQEDPNAFNEAFLGTPPTKKARKSYGPDFKTKVIKEARDSYKCHFSEETKAHLKKKTEAGYCTNSGWSYICHSSPGHFMEQTI